MLTFGTETIAAGEKKAFFLPVSKMPAGHDLGFPMMVVNGAGDGPTLLVDGGIHGDEYESGEAIRAIWRDTDPADLNGAFVGVPVVNVPSFEAGRRASPVDGINMNRIFPGRREGFMTEQLAFHYFNEIVMKCDMGLDLHGGGTALAISPTVIYRQMDDEDMESRLRELALATGIDIVWKGGGAWGGSLNLAAPRAGVPVVTAEVGGEGRCLETFVQQQRVLVENVMRNYEMIPGPATEPAERVFVRGTFQPCSTGGLYRTRVELRDRVAEGQLLGTISDLFGEVLEEVRAPHDGIVVSQRTFATIHPGDWTAFVGAPFVD